MWLVQPLKVGTFLSVRPGCESEAQPVFHTRRRESVRCQARNGAECRSTSRHATPLRSVAYYERKCEIQAQVFDLTTEVAENAEKSVDKFQMAAGRLQIAKPKICNLKSTVFRNLGELRTPWSANYPPEMIGRSAIVTTPGECATTRRTQFAATAAVERSPCTPLMIE